MDLLGTGGWQLLVLTYLHWAFKGWHMFSTLAVPESLTCLPYNYLTFLLYLFIIHIQLSLYSRILFMTVHTVCLSQRAGVVTISFSLCNSQ